MNTSDILMILGCLVIGYAVVSMALRKPGPPPAAPDPQPATPPAPPAPPPPPHWSTVLEISPDADIDQIREAYRRLIGQYHPDKVASLGRELQELAEVKSRAITSAYQDAVMARRTGA